MNLVGLSPGEHDRTLSQDRVDAMLHNQRPYPGGVLEVVDVPGQ
jgi:hypothetical protein